MRSTLKDLYYGNISPVDKTTLRGSAYGKALAELAAAEAALAACQSGEGAALLQRYQAAVDETNAIAEADCFITGFRLGTRLLLEALHPEEDGDFRAI